MIPENLKYTKDHEWARSEGHTIVVGITDHAQELLGDIVFVELPEVGARVKQGEAFGTVESVKAVSDLFAPATGEVVEVNVTLVDAPENVNSDPYGKAWLVKIKLDNPAEADALLSAADYTKILD